MKKLVALFLALTLCFSMVGFAAAEAVPHIQIMGYWEVGSLGGVDLNENHVAKKWQEDVGFTFEGLITPKDTFAVKVNTLLASEDMPDIIRLEITNGFDVMNEYGMRGKFVNINDYLHMMPNYSAYLEKYPEIRKIMTADDGNMYGFPYFIFDYADCTYETALIREDLLAKVGLTLDDCTTLEGLSNALLALREVCNPGGAVWGQREGYTAFMKKAGHLFDTYNGWWYNAETGAFEYASESAKFKTMLEWLNQMYAQDVIHKDWTTLSDAAWEGLLAGGQCLFTIDRMNICEDANFDPSFDFRPILNPAVDGKAAPQAKKATVDYSMPWVISAESDNIETCIKAIDYAYGQDAIKMMQCGVEGITYVPGDQTAAGIEWKAKVFGLNLDNENEGHYGVHGIERFEFVRNEYNVTKTPGAYPQIFVDFVAKVNEKSAFAVAQPAVKFTADEYDVVNGVGTSLQTYLDEQVVLFVEGDRSFDEWEDFQNEIRAMGLEEVQAVYDAALARWNAL